ncbi:hypothetical protein [Halotalea alkalilenta]|uniref:Uncharacterized protein n=1 Tax=Halotalea alkalilenta TaxID=376489 RepID=A0A172YC61_9GAMM|nr:hypothetical protein [Halotalea alkalilenta]ANF56595.1 hypothetical protein A5892_03180 [Halotalea alkalilenta]
MLDRFADLYEWMKSHGYVDALFAWVARLVLVGALFSAGTRYVNTPSGWLVIAVALTLFVLLFMQSIDGIAYLIKKWKLFSATPARLKQYLAGALGLAISAGVALVAGRLVLRLATG